MRSRYAGRLAAATVLLLVAGCGGGDPARVGGAGSSSAGGSVAPSASPTASPTPTAARLDPNGFPMPERPDCAVDSGGTFAVTTTSDGFGTGVLVIGSGTGGVVLAPQDGGDLCQMLPLATELAAHHRVAVFDWKDPRPEVLRFAAAQLRKAGATRVVVGGASYGGALAMSMAHSMRPRAAGVLSLGGELTLPPGGGIAPPGFDGRPGIRRWTGPVLAVGSRHDDLFDVRDAARLRALHPGPETVLMLPGDRHGIDLLDGPNQGQVRASIDRFLARVLR